MSQIWKYNTLSSPRKRDIPEFTGWALPEAASSQPCVALDTGCPQPQVGLCREWKGVGRGLNGVGRMGKRQGGLGPGRGSVWQQWASSLP